MSEFSILETVAGRALLKRSERKTLAISVLPDGTLELIAPIDTDDASILARVSRRANWIDRQRRTFASMNAVRAPRRYVSGATHRYLGRQYRLRVHTSDENSVRLRGAYFEIQTSKSDSKSVQQLLEAWFRTKAQTQFEKRIAKWIPWCARNGLPTPQVRVRKMPKRWGSAHPSGHIALNPELIHAPSACIDYVIAHEVCHLMFPSHGADFFRLLELQCPNWKTLKARLERSEIF
jgi:hypothetical protein